MDERTYHSWHKFFLSSDFAFQGNAPSINGSKWNKLMQITLINIPSILAFYYGWVTLCNECLIRINYRGQWWARVIKEGRGTTCPVDWGSSFMVRFDLMNSSWAEGARHWIKSFLGMQFFLSEESLCLWILMIPRCKLSSCPSDEPRPLVLLITCYL